MPLNSRVGCIHRSTTPKNKAANWFSMLFHVGDSHTIRSEYGIDVTLRELRWPPGILTSKK